MKIGIHKIKISYVAIIVIFSILIIVVGKLANTVNEMKPDTRTIAYNPRPGENSKEIDLNIIVAYALIGANKAEMGFVADCFDRAIKEDRDHAGKILTMYRLTYKSESGEAFGYNPNANMIDTVIDTVSKNAESSL